jgi:opacity protein-like surface antigen
MYTHNNITKEIESRVRGTQHPFLVLLLMLLPATAIAEDNVTRDIIEISPGIGYYHFDDDRNIEDTAMVTVGLGLQFSRRWLMLLHYSALKYDSTRPKVVIQKYHVDAHYFFNTENRLRPYLVAGFGQLDIEDAGIESKENMLNAGFGISYKMTPSWFVRTDARIFADTDNSYQDNALTLTLGYRFSGGEKGD